MTFSEAIMSEAPSFSLTWGVFSLLSPVQSRRLTKRPKAGGSPTLIYCNSGILIIIQYASVGCHLTDLLVRLLICSISVKLIPSSTWRCSFPNRLPVFTQPCINYYFYYIFYQRGSLWIFCYMAPSNKYNKYYNNMSDIDASKTFQSPWSCNILWILLPNTVIYSHCLDI